MWFDSLEPDRSWAALWHGYVRCICNGIRTYDLCTRCNAVLDVEPKKFVDDNGREFIVRPAMMGAEERFEDWVLLAMIEREWKRQDSHAWLDSIPSGHRPSPRANVVLLFWTCFETRIGRLLRAALVHVPEALRDDWLERNSKITARMTQAYGVLFDGASYRSDLFELGFRDIWTLLDDVRRARNSFAHGSPEAIDETLVHRVVENLKREHESWIAVFNRRAPMSTGAQRA